MARSDVALLLLVGGAALAGCTFTGIGDYEIATCDHPAGTSIAQTVGALSANADLAFTTSGANAIGAFVAPANGGTCVQAVDTRGFLNGSCLFFGGGTDLALVPRQPSVIEVGGGHAAAAVATTAPCTQGQLHYRVSAQGISGATSMPCESGGASLPSLATNGTSALLTWSVTSVASRADPIEDCAAATPAPLRAVLVTDAETGTPKTGLPIALSDTSTSMRAPAVLTDSNGYVVVAPNEPDVGVWHIDGTGTPTQPIAIPGLARARAVSAAISSDGAQRIAIVAEIDCSSHEIGMVIGTITGFSTVIEVASSPTDLEVAPSVAWNGNGWTVSWISTANSAHALARRYSATGVPVGAVVDPSLPATAVGASATGDILAFSPVSNSFVDASLGCPR